jgi:UDP:flavonoid glycosyltransferase YjiC (YdhE family)
MRPGPKTILFAPASNILFHVGRCLGLAKELDRRGHRVVFAGAPTYLQSPIITQENTFEFYELPDFSAEQALDSLRKFTRMPSRRAIKAMIEAELALLKRLQPDVVVVDFRLTMYLSAQRLGIPVVSLLLGVWMQQYSAVPPQLIRTHPYSRWLLRWVGEAGGARRTPTLLRLLIAYKMLPFARAARAYGLKPITFLWDLLDGDLNRLLDTAAWSPMKPLPPHFHQVGPILWEAELALPVWVEALDRRRPVVFINFGSTAHRDLFRQVFDDFAAAPFQVNVATGGQIDPRDFRIPANVHVEKFLPVGKIIARRPGDLSRWRRDGLSGDAGGSPQPGHRHTYGTGVSRGGDRTPWGGTVSHHAGSVGQAPAHPRNDRGDVRPPPHVPGECA